MSYQHNFFARPDLINLQISTSNFMEIFGSDNCKIIHADVMHGLAAIADNSIDLIFSDPPYNIGKNFNGHKDKWTHDEAYLEWCYSWLHLCCDKLKANGSLKNIFQLSFIEMLNK